MNYEKVWKEMKETIETAVRMGRSFGYDVEGTHYGNGCFDTYERILAFMEMLDKEDEE